MQPSKKLLCFLWCFMFVFSVAWIVYGWIYLQMLVLGVGIGARVTPLAVGYNSLDSRELELRKEQRERERKDSERDRDHERLRMCLYLDFCVIEVE